jgi:hypothetical protein
MGTQHFEKNRLFDGRPGRRAQRGHYQNLRTEILAAHHIPLIRVRYDEPLTEEMARRKLLEAGISLSGPEK